MKPDNPTLINKRSLRNAMEQAFNQEELKYLCDDLDVNIEDLAGTGRKEKIFELIKYLERRNRLPELFKLLHELRPNLGFTPIQIQYKRRYLGAATALIVLLLAGAAWVTAQSGAFCPYRGDNDYETIVQIIKAESLAANTGSLAVIEAIFARDAYIKQTEKAGGAVTEWFDPLAHYGPLFDNTKFYGAVHTNISGTVTGNYARFTSGSQGSYVTGEDYGEYNNRAGSPNEEEVWTFEKNLWGCWKITRFEFH